MPSHTSSRKCQYSAQRSTLRDRRAKRSCAMSSSAVPVHDSHAPEPRQRPSPSDEPTHKVQAVHGGDEVEERVGGIRVREVAEPEHLIPHHQLQHQERQGQRPSNEEGGARRALTPSPRRPTRPLESNAGDAEHHRVEPKQRRLRNRHPVRGELNTHMVGGEEKEEQHADNGEKEHQRNFLVRHGKRGSARLGPNPRLMDPRLLRQSLEDVHGAGILRNVQAKRQTRASLWWPAVRSVHAGPL